MAPSRHWPNTRRPPPGSGNCSDAQWTSMLRGAPCWNARAARPLNRVWKRWRDAALIAHVDRDGVAARVGAECAASDRLDCLPG